ncbi:MAG: hypothetical protein ACLU9S_13350 [Oscillospiraceae bacterium]
MNSLALMLCAWLFSGLIGFGLGCAMGMTRDRLPDRILKNSATSSAASPPSGWVWCFCWYFPWGWDGFPWVFPPPLASPTGRSLSGAGFMSPGAPALTLSLMSFCKHRSAHPAEAGGRAGERICPLCPGQRGATLEPSVRRHGSWNMWPCRLTLQFASFAELFGGSGAG